MEEYGLVDIKKTKMIVEKTPAKYIKKLTGRGGTFDYVEVGYVIDKLNQIFNYMWSFEIKEKTQNQSLTQVAVLGKLTGYIVIPTNPPMMQQISKEQWGGSDIKKWRAGTVDKEGTNIGGTPIDIANDYKSASSDALKKCASLLGVAQDVYWKSYEE